MEDSLRRYLTRAELAEAAFGRLAGLPLDGLWVAGNLDALAAPTVAVVGTRAPSEDGRRLAHRLAADLGAAGVCVLSGLALGVDAAAHAGALAAGAPTIGVLGGGHDRFFPPRNADLARRIVAAGGAVLSPYKPDHPAYPWQFLARNGVVAALADGVVVVEAAARSGALNTASWAADRGIPVMAVPGDVDRPKVAGCLALIRDGATLVRDAADILAQLGLTQPAPATAGSKADPSSRAPLLSSRAPLLSSRAPLLSSRAESRDRHHPAPADPILGLLAAGPADAETLISSSELPPVLTLARIGDLIASGTIVHGTDGRYRRS